MTRPNILFVCVDCLREDFVGTEHADTPFMNRIATNGINYTKLFATATTTTPCVASFMTGTYSERNGVFSLEEATLSESVPTLAEQFSAAGYNTTALVTGPLVASTGLDRGFNNYRYRDRRKELTGDWFNKAVDIIEELEEPFFCYLHLWEIHDPIRVPKKYDDPQYGEYSYSRTLSALDRSLESLYNRSPEDTIIALHGDHGEAIAYRGSFLHRVSKFLRTGLRYGLGIDTRSIERQIKCRFNADPSIPDHFMEDGHGETVFDFVTNVPFIIAGAGINDAVVNAQVRGVDIAPTLLDFAGIESDWAERIDGESLLPPESVTDRNCYIRACGKSLLREENWQRAVRSGGYKYIEYMNREWSYELYDLEVDPLELSPIEDDRIATRLRDQMPKEGDRDSEILAIDGLLEDLGYK